MVDEPKQLAGARRCGAKTRGARGGRPCRAPAVGGRARCRLHGGARGSGGRPGQANGMFRHGKYARETRELGRLMREIAREAEVLVAKTLRAHDLKPPKRLRRRTHVKRALAAAKAKGEQQ
jgi:hypothetical protein